MVTMAQKVWLAAPDFLALQVQSVHQVVPEREEMRVPEGLLDHLARLGRGA